jgi:phosphopantothenoylcysteine decarboxylase / phosphopantothenate---cysteine ligase
VIVMAAAVSDYRPAETVSGKRAKDDEPWSITLEPTVDVLAQLGGLDRNGQVLVGFGAEAGEAGLERKRAMLAGKNLDLVVYNDVSIPGIGFDAPENEVTLLSEAGERHVPRASKESIAAEIVDEVERLLGDR